MSTSFLVVITLCIMMPICFSVPFVLKYLYDHKIIILSDEGATRLNGIVNSKAFLVASIVVSAICAMVLFGNIMENTDYNYICCHCDRPFTEKIGSVKSVRNKYGDTDHYCNRCWNEIKTE